MSANYTKTRTLVSWIALFFRESHFVFPIFSISRIIKRCIVFSPTRSDDPPVVVLTYGKLVFPFPPRSAPALREWCMPRRETGPDLHAESSFSSCSPYGSSLAHRRIRIPARVTAFFPFIPSSFAPLRYRTHRWSSSSGIRRSVIPAVSDSNSRCISKAARRIAISAHW